MLLALKRMDTVLSTWLCAAEETRLDNSRSARINQYFPDLSQIHFKISDNVHCFQKEHVPEALWMSFVQLVSICYDDSVSPSDKRIEKLTKSRQINDFFILSTTQMDPMKVIAGCMIRVRANTFTEIPYMYVHTVGTLPQFRRKGLAGQMIHAAYALGTCILQSQLSKWKVIDTNRLDVVVAVDVDKQKNIDLYKHLGFRFYSEDSTFTLDKWLVGADDLYVMFSTVTPKTIYEDNNVLIYLPNHYDPGAVYLNHVFPESKLRSVLSHGLIPSTQAGLYPVTDEIYIMPENHIDFELMESTDSVGCAFVILAKQKNQVPLVCIQIAMPSWFAVSIGAQCRPR